MGTKRFGAKRSIATMLFCFGCASLATGFVKSFHPLVVCRVFVGLFESGFLASSVSLSPFSFLFESTDFAFVPQDLLLPLDLVYEKRTRDSFRNFLCRSDWIFGIWRTPCFRNVSDQGRVLLPLELPLLPRGRTNGALEHCGLVGAALRYPECLVPEHRGERHSTTAPGNGLCPNIGGEVQFERGNHRIHHRSWIYPMCAGVCHWCHPHVEQQLSCHDRGQTGVQCREDQPGMFSP